MATERNNYSEIFLEMLNDSMERYSLNQSGLASKLGKNRSMVTKWLNKQQVPYIGTVKEIAEALNYSITKRNNNWELNRLQINDKKINTSPSTSALLEKVEEVLLEMVENATPEERSVISKCAIKLQGELMKWALENQIPKPE